MVEHGSRVAWEKRLKAVFDEIDDHLEDRYGRRFPLHPRRSDRDTTSNKEQDGLFNVGASYTLCIGSRHGPGYAVEVRISTLTAVPKELRRRIQREVAALLRRKLPTAFPERSLRVRREGDSCKIVGDFSLGPLMD